jgi:DNA-binding NarL/FixJ family response regulator
MTGLDEADHEVLRSAREQLNCRVLVVADDMSQVDFSNDKVLPVTVAKPKFLRTAIDMGLKERPRVVIHEDRPRYLRSTVLTPRENDIALKIAEGLSNRDIASELNLAEQTVKNLVSVIMRKMGCRNRVQVALILSKMKHDKK